MGLPCCRSVTPDELLKWRLGCEGPLRAVQIRLGNYCRIKAVRLASTIGMLALALLWAGSPLLACASSHDPAANMQCCRTMNGRCGGSNGSQSCCTHANRAQHSRPAMLSRAGFALSPVAIPAVAELPAPSPTDTFLTLTCADESPPGFTPTLRI